MRMQWLLQGPGDVGWVYLKAQSDVAPSTGRLSFLASLLGT